MVAEVKRSEVEEVNNQDEFGPVEVRANKEHDECKVEEVVDDEVASHAGSGIDMARVGRKEVTNVASLENEEDDPEGGGDDRVQGEGTWVKGVLVPNTLPNCVAIVRRVDGVVDGDDEREDPGNEGEGLVGSDGPRAVGFPFAKGIILVPLSHGCGLVMTDARRMLI
jgi:hypothetical protein